MDESYFGAQRVRVRRGRGAYGKTIVFLLLKRQGMIYKEGVPDSTKAILQGIIRDYIGLASVIHSDGWPGYDGLVDIGFDKHFRVNHVVPINSPRANVTATASRASKAMQNGGWPSSMA